MKTAKLSLLLIVILLIQYGLHANAAWKDIDLREFRVAAPPELTVWPAEIDVMLALQAERDPKDCALARKRRHPRFQSLFASRALMSDKEQALVKPFINRVLYFGERVTSFYKENFERERPFQFDKRVKPCVKKPVGSKSYPSSHASTGALGACILGLIFPQRKSQMEAWGRDIGNQRVRVGVHFPSDVEAGQQLAKSMCERLQTEPDFQREVRELRR